MKNPTLHEDLMVEILLRLPVRSLLRFKCVCKSWFSLISNPQFAKSHFDLAAAPTHRLLLPTESVIESLDFEASIEDDSSIVQLDLQVPQAADGFLNTGGSCRGFIVLVYCRVIIVWNPSTGTRRVIPLSRIQICGCLIGKGIGYDQSRDDYLILLVVLDLDPYNPAAVGDTRVEVFSLKTNTSYFIPRVSEVGYDCISPELTTGLFLNHSLHWLLKSNANQLPLILAFNLIDRSLSEILLPHETLELIPTPKYLNLIGGCLSLCISGTGQTAMCTIWIMKKYKVHSSWTKSFVLSLDNYPYNFFVPICFTKGVDLLGSSLCGRLIKLNDKGELIECREHRALNRKSGLLKHYNIYRESLLSLPDDFAQDEEEATENEESKEDEEAVGDD